jgi:putative DNA primase/helicase
MMELPYLAHGPIAQSFAEQTKDFGYLYDRGQSAAWVGSRWSIGDRGDLLLKAAIGEYCTDLYTQYPTGTQRRALLLDSRFRQGVLTEAKPLLPKWKFSERFDQDPFLLAVPGNRVVNLKTGELRATERGDFVTKRTRVAPDPNEPKLFLKFMDEITNGDTALRDYLLRFCGYALTGSTREHCLPFWYGAGGNGKGTLLNILQFILGYEYSTVVRMNDLLHKEGGNDNQRRILASLCGARLVCCNEANRDIELDMALLKSLSSSDMLSGAFLYENEFRFVPTHKLVIALNSKPILETDDAAKRRVHLVPFNVSFRGRENKGLDDALKDEAGGILHLLIRGCLQWQERGLDPPPSVVAATEGLFRELDILGRFMDERLERDDTPDAFVFTSDLVKAYSNFLAAEGQLQHIDERKLMAGIKERGNYEPGVKRDSADKRKRGLRGARIKDPDNT